MSLNEDVGGHKYEVGIYRAGKLEEVYSTDSKDSLPTIVSQADNRLDFLRKKFPGEEYSAKRIRGLKIRTVSCP